jgi:hypothetical protein
MKAARNAMALVYAKSNLWREFFVFVADNYGPQEVLLPSIFLLLHSKSIQILRFITFSEVIQ